MPTSVSTIVIPMNYLNFTPTFFAATGQREPKNGELGNELEYKVVPHS